MKTVTVIWCLFLCSFAMGQRKDEFKRLVLGEYNYTYNTGNAQLYYEQANDWWLTITPKYIEIKHDFNCSCGCVLSIYKKIQDAAPLVVKMKKGSL